MPTILKGKPDRNDYMDAIGVAVFKNVEERLLSPVIGNGTLGSGIAKGIAGAVTPAIMGSNKWSKMITTAFVVDSAEDILNAFIGGMNLGGSNVEVI